MAPCHKKLKNPSNGYESFEEVMREKQGVEFKVTLLRETGIHSLLELEKKLQWFLHVKIIPF
jgi:hypothetical protein